MITAYRKEEFQSSFELTGYITARKTRMVLERVEYVSKLFRAYRLYNGGVKALYMAQPTVSKLFRAYRLYNITDDVRIM